jgi:hypothetical protein
MRSVIGLAPAVAALALLGSAAGCKGGEECERARMQTASSWENVKTLASKLKFEGTADYDSWPAARKAEHNKTFTEIESAAGLVFESFAFQKITWTGAKNGRTRARKNFDEYPDKEKYPSFAAALSGAEKKYDAAEAACR